MKSIILNLYQVYLINKRMYYNVLLLHCLIIYLGHCLFISQVEPNTKSAYITVLKYPKKMMNTLINMDYET